MTTQWAPSDSGWVEGGAPMLDDERYETLAYSDGQGHKVGWHRRLPNPAHLPTKPGFYLVGHPDYGTGPVVIELLANATQWVDCSDTHYLTPQDAAAHMPLTGLVPESGTTND